MVYTLDELRAMVLAILESPTNPAAEADAIIELIKQYREAWDEQTANTDPQP